MADFVAFFAVSIVGLLLSWLSRKTSTLLLFDVDGMRIWLLATENGCCYLIISKAR